ncbi:LysR family transcriptional regulator [Bosea sp. F3-2]|uniref:LysR family transcriptional regulator n=1 Tax=Bosea sp. F3-2 TaxID=2599640 RepID=UPI001655E4D9|nr:LysR family transcriptional regulator [Bosea sp. F3-2]
MELWQLRYFVAVSEGQSIAQASTRLHVASPAISRVVKGLEDELGVRLFNRDGRGMQLTDSGRLLLDHATNLLRDAELARREVASSGAQLSGDVTIGATPSLISVCGLSLVRRCREIFPKIQPCLVEGYSGYLLNWARAGTVDFAFVNGSSDAGPRLMTEHIATERLFAIGTREIMAKYASGIPLKSLLDQPILLPSPQNSIHRLLVDYANRSSLTITPLMDVDSVTLMKDLVMDGMSIGVLPYGAVQREVEHGLMAAVPIVDPEVHSTTHLVYQKDRPPERLGRAVIDLMRGILSEFRSTHDCGAIVEVP